MSSKSVAFSVHNSASPTIAQAAIARSTFRPRARATVEYSRAASEGPKGRAHYGNGYAA